MEYETLHAPTMSASAQGTIRDRLNLTQIVVVRMIMHNRQGAESAKKFKNLASLAFLAVKKTARIVCNILLTITEFDTNDHSSIMYLYGTVVSSL